MDVASTPEQKMLRDTFADLFATESSLGRVRRAEETGFNGDLWRRLAETSVLGLLEAAIPNLFDSGNNKRIFSISDWVREPDASHQIRS